MWSECERGIGGEAGDLKGLAQGGLDGERLVVRDGADVPHRVQARAGTEHRCERRSIGAGQEECWDGAAGVNWEGAVTLEDGEQAGEI